VTVVAGRELEVTTTTAPAGPPPARRRTRVALWAGAAAGVVVLVALVGALTTPRTTRGDLEPTSAAPEGARAVAEILRRQGVDVRAVSRSADLDDAPGTTTVVVRSDALGPDQLDRVAATRGPLVLVQPDLLPLQRLAPFARPAGVVDGRRAAAGCTGVPAAQAAGEARAGGSLYRLAGAPAPGTTLCYPAEGDAERGSLVVGDVGGRTVVVLGQADVVRNSHLADPDGTAALALTLLGTTDTLQWYLPGPEDVAAGPDAPTLGDLTPRWVPFVAWQLVVVAVLAMLWRGRRLGRLVTEPLPVVVRAAETSEGRARLYRRAKAYGRAAATLRTAALRRLARRLDVPPDAPPETVVALVAQATGLPQPALAATFLGPAPTDDRGLVRLADEIALAEDRVAAAGGAPAR
jgi:hypothetical protein